MNLEWLDALQVQIWTADRAGALTGDPYAVDFRLLRAADRMYRWHHASARLLAGPDGPFWLGSNVEVDAERRAEEVAEAARVLALRSNRG